MSCKEQEDLVKKKKQPTTQLKEQHSKTLCKKLIRK